MEKAINSRGMFPLVIVLGLFLAGIISDVLAKPAKNFPVEDSSWRNEITAPDTNAATLEKQSGSWKVGGFPIIFYSDETRWAGGAGVQWVRQTKSKKHSSSIGIIGFYTQNKQYVFQISPDLYLKAGAYLFSAGIGHSYYPDKFYGIGNHTHRDDEEDFTYRSFGIRPSVQKRLFANLYVGVQYDFSDEKLTEIEEGKLLASGTISGSNGGSVSGFGLVASWDSRNDNLYPTQDSYHQFTAIFYQSALGSDFNFDSYRLDLRHYLRVFNQQILALQGIISINTGNPPFQSLNPLGLFLRGYYQNRFVDKNLIAGQAEYRLPLIGRFGLVGFVGCGQVARIIENFAIQELKPSAGFGIRFAVVPEQKVNLRIDFGFGKDDSSFDISLMELF